MIDVRLYSGADKDLWNSFVAKAKNATFLFDRGFMDYHSDRFEDHSLMIFKDQKLIAVLPAHKSGQDLVSHNGLTYGGFVWSRKIKFLDAFEAFKAVLSYADCNDFAALEIKEIPRIYHQLPSDESDYFMNLCGAQCIKKEVLLVIDYRDRLSFEKNRREGMNKALRHDLEVRVDGNFKEFWDTILMPQLHEKHQATPVHTLAEIELLAQRFPDNIKQVSVYHNNKLVAGTTVFLTPTTVHPQYVMGNEQKNTLGSLDLAYDYIMEHFEEDRRFFNFNSSSEEQGKLLNRGLLFWKETCGARCITATQYRVSSAAHKTLNLQFT
jgi:hypothetical protein